MMNMISELIKNSVINNPEKTAYIIGERRISYRELWEKSESYAGFLKKQGISPVIVLGKKEPFVIISIIACIIAERAYVPVLPSTPKDRLKKIIAITESSLIITEDDPTVDNIECRSLEELAIYETEAEKYNTSNIVYIIFTSGSTGDPKGVPITRSNLVNFILWISKLRGLYDLKNARIFNQAYFSFDLSVADLFFSLCNGHTLVAYDKDMNQEFGGISYFFEKERIDAAIMTPTFAKLCLLDDNFKSDICRDLKCIYFCGELLEKKTVEKLRNRFPKLCIINAYGPTEATSAISAVIVTEDMLNSEDPLPVGDISTLATDVCIENNEIILKGSSVFCGYLGNIKGGYFVENGINCYRTGDLGKINNGMLYCKGRFDNQIKYKGYRIELSDIKNNIEQIQGVSECAVIAKYDDNGCVRLIKAFVTGEKNLNSFYIYDSLRVRLPDYMIPKTIKILDELPINQNGKTDRKALGRL